MFIWLVYDSRVWACLARLTLLAIFVFPVPARTQDGTHPQDTQKTEPKYDDTFSGPIVEISPERITVSRSILGKTAEKRSFWIKPDTRIEGKLRPKVRVTVGFVTTDEGDIARLIVVRTTWSSPKKK